MNPNESLQEIQEWTPNLCILWKKLSETTQKSGDRQSSEVLKNPYIIDRLDVPKSYDSLAIIYRRVFT
jgi:hypothetical protein